MLDGNRRMDCSYDANGNLTSSSDGLTVTYNLLNLPASATKGTGRISPMAKGFMYLTAIIDVYSRYIVGWSLHNTLDASNCIEVLKNAIAKYGAPEIINSDQRRQFTCQDWKETCAEHPEMKISMDGRDRAKDNIWIERFWRTIKYDYIYIQPPCSRNKCSAYPYLGH